MASTTTAIERQSPPEAKVALFRSLFQGRTDVYPRRFENHRTGKSGYAPACGNEWVRGVCDKPRTKCSACSHQRFLPVTDDVIRWHLSGEDATGRPFVAGVYPMLRDETCHFLAADLDKKHWQEDALAIMETCRRMSLPAALERSRSGNSGHIWLFFQEPISAAMARKLGAHVLTETMERRPEIGLESYDRFVPNQDTLPQVGFGNLIALPLQKIARDRGNSVFLDDSMRPHADQWAFLSSIQRIDRSTVEEMVSAAEHLGRVVGGGLYSMDEDSDGPWALLPARRPRQLPLKGPLPSRIELVLANQAYIAKEGLPPGLHNRLIRLAAFQNPEFYKAQTLRLPIYGKPRIVACAEDHPQLIGIPRGCLEDLKRVLTELRIDLVIHDTRFAGHPLNVEFRGELRPEQEAAAKDMLAHDTGVLAATTAFGKTVIAAWLIAKRGVNTLVLVHRRQLLDQWVERLSAFLDLPVKAIGRIGGGRKKPTGSLDVAIFQSLIHNGAVNDLVRAYGYLIIDECHHVSAHGFEQIARHANAKFVTGLSATVTRKDGRHPIIFMQCGPVRHCVDAKSWATARPIEHTVQVRPTGFWPTGALSEDSRQQFQELYSQLIANEARNQLICADVLQAVRDGRSPLVVTERKEHLDHLAKCISESLQHVIVLCGGKGSRESCAMISRLAAVPEAEQRVVLATGRYVGEGFDDPRLDTLFLTLPISWRGTIAQYVGRLHRRHPGKCEVHVYDYADLNVPILARMFDRRCRGYEAVGYRMWLPASAVPGWPVEVPLPVEPRWKNDYAATVRRLVRDGVDAPLAELFVHASRDVLPDAEGVDRARSATEAFLFRRLASMPNFRGLFRLNAELPIPFDGHGRMEVDLLCEDAGVAIELDGPQHLESVDAYRRDRRKDRLLQEHGYFVLRFLAEDVGKHLDVVLDTILRAISHRRERQS